MRGIRGGRGEAITRNSRLRLPSGFAHSQTSVADLTLDYLFPLLYDSLLPLRYSLTLSGVSSLLPSLFPPPATQKTRTLQNDYLSKRSLLRRFYTAL